MEDNIYEPPKSDIRVAEGKPGSIVKAVALGALVEVAGSFLVGIVIGVIYVVLLSRQGVALQEIEKTLTQMDPFSGIGLLALTLGSLVSVLAGYICASIANSTSYKAAYMLAAISCALAIFSGYGVYSQGVLVLMGGLSVACVLVGAWWRIGRLKAV
ncbi:MAG: hypothetical protein P8103_12220 [Candidatus Thiodiazotropha sp.]